MKGFYKKKSKETFEEEEKRERDLELEKELLNPQIKGITNFYSSFEGRKPMNSSYRDLLTT